MSTTGKLVKKILDTVLPSGKTLSERVWELATYEKDIISIVKTGLAQELIPVENMAKMLDSFILPGRQVTTLTPYGRTLNFDSMRLARTEVMTSFRTAADESMKATPWIIGQEFTMNDSHPDGLGCECEDYNGHVFGIDEDKPSLDDLHPQCGCYYVDVLMTDEEWDAALDAWENDPSDDPYGIGDWMGE